MKWFDNWLKRRIQNATLNEPEWWKQAGMVISSSSGKNVTVSTALTVSAVYGCVRVISEAIASLPLRIMERTEEGRQVADHPLNSVFRIPNSIQTGYEMREFIGSSLCLRGNSYAQKIRSRRGQTGELIPLYPHLVKPEKDSRGRLIFDYQETGSTRVFQQDEIWRIAGLSTNGVTGLSPIGLARESIGLALALEEHGAKLFKNGTQTATAFELDSTLSDPAYERLKKELAEHQGSANAWKPLILEGGMKHKAIGMTAEDSQFIATRKLQVADIARFYRVPLHMLNELDRATFSNIEHQSIEFVRDTLTPWLVRIEDSIYRDLLTPEERENLYAKHSVNGLLRGDIKTRFEAYRSSVGGPWMSRNEARSLEDMNDIDGLDEMILPLNVNAGRRETDAQMMAILDDLVKRETGVIDRERNSGMLHFVDFYDRHLRKAADMLNIDRGHLVPYGQARLAEIEAGITDDYVAQVRETGAEQMRGYL